MTDAFWRSFLTFITQRLFGHCEREIGVSHIFPTVNRGYKQEKEMQLILEQHGFEL